MLNLLNLIPAALCLLGALMIALTMRADLATGALRWRDKETAIGSAIILTCAIGAAISSVAALEVLAR